MRKLQSLRKFAGTVFACLAFFVAQKAATQVCFIFYQDEIPEKVREIKKRPRSIQLKNGQPI